jgi:hypothetical protein
MAASPCIRLARVEEAAALSEQCVRSKAAWGYDEAAPHSITSLAHARIDGGIVRPSALAALSPFGPHARSAISAILRNVNTRRRFASGSFAISASVSAIVVPYAWYVGISASGG